MNQKTSTSTKRTLIIMALIIVAGITAGVISTQFKTSKTPDHLSGYGGEFTLQSADGPVSLSDFKGKVVAIYFGYTSCPDACPTTLAMFANVMKKLEKDELAKVQVLLISFDPERDTPEDLETYVKQFHPQMIGLTGASEYIAQIVKRYGGIYERVELPNSAMGYAFDHSSVSAIVDIDGNLRSLVRHQDSVNDILVKLREAMH